MQDLSIVGVLIIPVVIGVTQKAKSWFGWSGKAAEIFATAFGFVSAVLAFCVARGLLADGVVLALEIVYGALAFVITPQGLYDYLKPAISDGDELTDYGAIDITLPGWGER